MADTHGLVVHLDDEKRAIAGLTALLALWAGSHYGIGHSFQLSAISSKNHMWVKGEALTLWRFCFVGKRPG